jgi:hypothetical protein
VVAWVAGPREASLAEAVVRATRARTAGRAGVGWLSDGWAPYAEAIDRLYRDPLPAGPPGWAVLEPVAGVALTQAIKRRKGRRLERVAVRATIGEAASQPYDVHVERLNGVLRDRLACLTRKTHAFAKDARTWDAALGLALFEHNGLRPHPALRTPLPEPAAGRRYARRTPAQAIGLADHAWTWLEFLTRPVPHHQ